MKNIILAIVAVAAISTPAFAADRAVKSRPVVAPAYSWTGGYVGASVGYGWDSTSASHGYTNCEDLPIRTIFGGCGLAAPAFGGTAPPPVSFNGKGALAGLQWGYNYQFGAGLIGVEADYSWSRVNGDGTSTFSLAVLGTNTLGNAVSTQNLDAFGTIRGRLGWLPTQHWLLYVTSGFAFGHASREVTLLPSGGGSVVGNGFGFRCVGGQPCFLGNQKQSTVGWTVGGGTEWAISSNVTVKAEYLYANLAGTTVTAIAVDGFGQAPSSFQTFYDPIHLHVARLGINYRFNTR